MHHICRSSSIVERPHLEETMQVQPLPSATTHPSEPITRSEGQDMAEVMPTLTSATLKRTTTQSEFIAPLRCIYKSREFTQTKEIPITLCIGLEPCIGEGL